MSNETTQKRSLSVSLGAAFLMATSAIGPGFLTQTSQFTAKYLSSFAFVIVCVIIMDMIAQTNVWSIVGVSGLRGQEIANKVLPGLGYLLVVLVVLGGLAFNIGNVGGVSLGFNAMIGIPEKAGVIIGGAVILGAYETGTGIYRLMNMQGLPLPSDRIELAELVWERAGKPEPQNMTDENLYADIDAADTDAQKAAHWMVEQELMKFDEDNNKFHPCFPVSKLRVCLTWQNAKDKGLND